MALVGAQFVNAVSPNPVGSLQAYAGASAPTGWLLCDGTSYSTSVYPELYSVLGYTYGGSGANFNVPDLRGRVPIGPNSDSTAANTATRSVGAKGGDTRLQTHTHTGTTGNGSANHSHVLRVNYNTTMNLANVAGGTGGFGLSSAAGSPLDVWENGSAHTHGFTTNTHNQPVGTGENMPPFLVTNYIIKAIPDAPRSGLAYGSTPPIVTALPSNPQFGDVVTYIADATNGVAWNLQYDATGTYPWKFIGGANLIAGNATGGYGISEIGPTTTYVQTLAGSPSITLPLPGDYRARVTAVGRASNSSAAPGLWISFGGATCPNWNSSDSIATGISGGSAHPLAANKTGTVTAGQTVTLNYTNANLGGSATFFNIRLDAIPVRVART